MLIIRDLVKVYPGPVAALQGIHLEVPNGMFGLLGPNGAGKSTLMKIIAGLLEPTSGIVTLDGKNIVQEPEQVWSRLGYLPQDFGFYPHLSVRAMLAHLLRLKGVRAQYGMRRLCTELLERVNLEWAAKRKVRELSGGMRQRLGVAQALAGDPRIIIVDEPTAGLDPEERLRFYHLLAELAQNRIVLLSTHIVEDVAVLCPNFAVIREGRLLTVTTPGEALATMQGRVFEGETEDDTHVRMSPDQVVTQALLFEGRTRIRVFCGNSPPPPGFDPVPETLEDAYLVMMRTNGALMPSTRVPEETADAETPLPEATR